MGKRSNGEGTIFKRQDGRWCAQYTMSIDGAEKRKTVYGKTQKEVKEKLNTLKATIPVKNETEISKYTLSTWMRQWLENYKKPAVKVTTYQGYWMIYRSHIEKSDIAEIPISQLTTAVLQTFYNHLWSKGRSDGKGGLSPRMVRYVYVLVHGALEQAIRNELIERNVNQYVTIPGKEHKEIIPLSLQEAETFLEQCKDERLYALYVLALNTGMRKGELLGLQWHDIDFDKKQLTVVHNLALIAHNDIDTEEPRKSELFLTTPKSVKSKRTIPLNDFVVSQLLFHRERQAKEKEVYKNIYVDNSMVFCREDGTYIHPRYLLNNFQNILKKAGMQKYRFHDLRHTVASLLINNNENPKVVQELLGHSNISTTLDIYTFIQDETKRNTVSKLGDILTDKKTSN
jgi:integrase